MTDGQAGDTEPKVYVLTPLEVAFTRFIHGYFDGIERSDLTAIVAGIKLLPVDNGLGATLLMSGRYEDADKVLVQAAIAKGLEALLGERSYDVRQLGRFGDVADSEAAALMADAASTKRRRRQAGRHHRDS